MRGAARFFLVGVVSLACADGRTSVGGAAGAGAIDCQAPPGKAVTVFLEGAHLDPRAATFHGVTFGAAEPGSVPRYPFTARDAAQPGGQVERRLAFFDPGGALPVIAGRAYDLAVEMVMGEPSAGAIVLSDADGLVLAAASDTGLGENVLAAGPPGFTLRLVEAGCRGREVTKCFVERVNLALDVTHEDEATHERTTVRLGHGQKARVGLYEVACQAAERVKYSPQCADAGVLAVSWTIRRVALRASPSGKP
ncbi:MAG TPA: hypothetical protein VGS03_14800 [Candidatus Polarisedimenticolia bacterium]|nr:hypothetical protein [Candidatus Polarisedimenticolia bacterium]